MFSVFLFLAVGNNTSEDNKTMVAMETQPVVEPVKTEVSPDTGSRAEASEATRVETRGWRLGEEEEGGEKVRRREGLCL